MNTGLIMKRHMSTDCTALEERERALILKQNVELLWSNNDFVKLCRLTASTQ